MSAAWSDRREDAYGYMPGRLERLSQIARQVFIRETQTFFGPASTQAL